MARRFRKRHSKFSWSKYVEGRTDSKFQAASGVADQPMSDSEGLLGARNRAIAALERAKGSTFGVGMEGALSQIGEKWFESGWIVIIDRDGVEGTGSSARFEMPPQLMEKVLTGQELGDVMDSVTGRSDVRTSDGAMGVLTCGLLPRDQAYFHGVLFALIPWLSPKF